MYGTTAPLHLRLFYFYLSVVDASYACETMSSLVLCHVTFTYLTFIQHGIMCQLHSTVAILYSHRPMMMLLAVQHVVQTLLPRVPTGALLEQLSDTGLITVSQVLRQLLNIQALFSSCSSTTRCKKTLPAASSDEIGFP